MSSVLVIDDNRLTADSLCQMLSVLGHAAHSVYGPRDAILRLREQPVDVILLDLAMPGVDGFELMSFFHREPALASIPVIVVTSDDQPETARRARRAGAKGVVVKPASVEGLESALRACGLG